MQSIISKTEIKNPWFTFFKIGRPGNRYRYHIGPNVGRKIIKKKGDLLYVLYAPQLS
jgi:hypothetical protein